MAKKTKQRSYNDVLAVLGSEKFDVSPAGGGANRSSGGGNRVSKYGCAAEIAPGESEDTPVRLTAKAGWLLGGEIARVIDRGYQKFLKTSRLEIPATAEHLKAIHAFNEELKESIGALSLYNESLGSVSDKYIYDRVKGRE